MKLFGILFFVFCVEFCLGEVEDGRNATEGLYATKDRPIQKRICECGKTNRNHKIVGGQPTETNEYPWMDLKCISFRNPRTRPTTLIIVLGDHDLDEGPISSKFRVRASKVIIHPRYDSVTMDSDISLVELESAVKFNSAIRPVCLPSNTLDVSGKDVIVIGWGSTSEDGALSTKPLEVSVPVVSNQRCQRYYKNMGIRIFPKMLCAGTGGKDSCQGDSGGPLITESQHGHCTVVGVVSFGIGCARPDYPGVYTRVTSFMQWIRRTTMVDICVKS